MEKLKLEDTKKEAGKENVPEKAAPSNPLGTQNVTSAPKVEGAVSKTPGTNENPQDGENVVDEDGQNEGENKPETSSDPAVHIDPERRKYLMSLLRRSFGLDTEEDWPEQVLDEVSVDGIARYIKSGKCANIITMAGAGISTSAGIPDFRSPDSGIYKKFEEKYNMSPTEVFNINYFQKDPEPFYQLRKEMWSDVYKPTPCHYFIKLLEEKGLLLRHYTQNIDALENLAGIGKDRMVQAHGSLDTSHCLDCDKEYTKEWVQEQVFQHIIPTCDDEDCNGFVKPGIVMFGESLPMRFFQCAKEDLDKCDLLIIMGTSLAVKPFATIQHQVKETAPRMYINLTKPTGGSDPVWAMMGIGHGFLFDEEKNYRDVFMQSKCDDACFTLAEKIGWKDEFQDMINSGNASLDKDIRKRKADLQKIKSKSKGDSSYRYTQKYKDSLIVPEPPEVVSDGAVGGLLPETGGLKKTGSKSMKKSVGFREGDEKSD